MKGDRDLAAGAATCLQPTSSAGVQDGTASSGCLASTTELGSKRRASRRARVRGRLCRLQERDVEILHAIAKMRMLRTSDLVRLLFGARGTCQKRLRRLFDAGLVRAVVTDLARENRFVLTRLGHALLLEALDGRDVPTLRSAPRMDGRNVTHLDFLNEYRIGLALGAARHALTLRPFIPEWELRAQDPTATLIPDALCILTSERGATWQLAVEVDTGTEAPAVVESKLGKYAEAGSSGGVFGFKSPLVLLVVPKLRRAQTIARMLIKTGGSPVPLALGLSPFVCTDGGLTTGLALPEDLNSTGEAERDARVFVRGLLSRS